MDDSADNIADVPLHDLFGPLPTEIHAQIFKNISSEDRARICSVNRMFLNCALIASRNNWKHEPGLQYDVPARSLNAYDYFDHCCEILSKDRANLQYTAPLLTFEGFSVKFPAIGAASSDLSNENELSRETYDLHRAFELTIMEIILFTICVNEYHLFMRAWARLSQFFVEKNMPNNMPVNLLTTVCGKNNLMVRAIVSYKSAGVHIAEAISHCYMYAPDSLEVILDYLCEKLPEFTIDSVIGADGGNSVSFIAGPIFKSSFEPSIHKLLINAIEQGHTDQVRILYKYIDKHEPKYFLHAITEDKPQCLHIILNKFNPKDWAPNGGGDIFIHALYDSPPCGSVLENGNKDLWFKRIDNFAPTCMDVICAHIHKRYVSYKFRAMIESSLDLHGDISESRLLAYVDMILPYADETNAGFFIGMIIRKTPKRILDNVLKYIDYKIFCKDDALVSYDVVMKSAVGPIKEHIRAMRNQSIAIKWICENERGDEKFEKYYKKYKHEISHGRRFTLPELRACWKKCSQKLNKIKLENTMRFDDKYYTNDIMLDHENQEDYGAIYEWANNI